MWGSWECGRPQGSRCREALLGHWRGRKLQAPGHGFEEYDFWGLVGIATRWGKTGTMGSRTLTRALEIWENPRQREG